MRIVTRHNSLECAHAYAEYPYSEAWRERRESADDARVGCAYAVGAFRAGVNDEYTAASGTITFATTAGMGR